MIRKEQLARGSAALILSLAISGCDVTKDVVNPNTPVDPLFSSYVALGNSITAGFQAGGINSTTQHQSFAVLLAQAMGTRFTVPSLRDPGCPPPIDNLLTGHRVGDGSATECLLRSDIDGAAVINNVAVPGANSFDPTDPMGAGANNALTTLILGGETQVERALDAKPTFVSIWLGNNDVLPAALSGILAPLPGVSPGVTAPEAFASNYAQMLSALEAGGSVQGGVLIGVVNVSLAPIFMPARALFNPQVRDAVEAYLGRPVTLDASCTPSTISLLNFQLIAAIKAGTQPDVIACEPKVGDPGLLGNVYVLDGSELAALAQTVAAYNAAIEAKATELGWAYVDPNPVLMQLRTDGLIPVIPDLAEPSQAFGSYISLDGVHPAAAAHALFANIVADAINAKYGTNIPTSE
ncbi:MAG TPA: SGNH/GDSL hydrolase family protein [Gemmatimonadaceae bacterium]